MKSYFLPFAFLCLFASRSSAQGNTPRHGLELGGGGVFPVLGHKAAEYSPVPRFARAMNCASPAIWRRMPDGLTPGCRELPAAGSDARLRGRT